MHARIARRLAGVALLLAALAALPAGAEIPSAVILISLDGTRPADVEGADFTTFAQLRRRGARASRLTTVFPSNTFPSHVTLVTGVHPDVHGIVNNNFIDPERGGFDKSDDPTWLLAEPLWSLLAQHGVASASFHWVGSEGPWSSGRGPRYWKKFEEKVPADTKFEQVLAWLAGPEPRPRFVTVWLRGADAAAHKTGMDTPAVRRALLAQDQALGRLVAGLDARGAFAHTTLLIVSDHGMAPVRRRVDLAAALRSAGVKGEVLGAGGMASIRVEKDQGFVERTVSVARGLGLQAWPRELSPRELHARHPRFGDVIVVAPIGVAIQSAFGPPMHGAHGYPPEESWMGALFLAVGRGAEPGAELGELSSLDVAPTVLRLLGLPVPDTMQGQPIARLLPGTAAASAAGASGSPPTSGPPAHEKQP
jgi:predicted AlkP superfamily pyrophosphatase or phosphodiesterase